MENIPESLSFDSEFKIPGMENDQENDGGFTKGNLMNWTMNVNSNGTTNQEDKSGFGQVEQKLDESVTEMKQQMWTAMLGPDVESKGSYQRGFCSNESRYSKKKQKFSNFLLSYW